MKHFVVLGSVALLFSISLAPKCLGDSRAHHAAIKLCRQKYKSAVRGAKYLKHRQRVERIEQARRERHECEKLAPK
jgi:hypothetical protein